MKTDKIVLWTGCIIGAGLGLHYLWKTYGDTQAVTTYPELKLVKDVPELPGEVVRAAAEPTAPIAKKKIALSYDTSAKVVPLNSLKPIPIANDEFPLKLGSKGNRILRLRIWLLRQHGFNKGMTDTFDSELASGIKKHLKTDEVSKERYDTMQMGLTVFEQEKNNYYG